jgi:hypothetical protein
VACSCEYHNEFFDLLKDGGHLMDAACQELSSVELPQK